MKLRLKIFTGRNEVVAKVMFLHVSVILLTGGVSGEPPPGPGRPPLDQADPPPGPRRPPAGKNTLQHTVNERPVRILLECILVTYAILNLSLHIKRIVFCLKPIADLVWIVVPRCSLTFLKSTKIMESVCNIMLIFITYSSLT